MGHEFFTFSITFIITFILLISSFRLSSCIDAGCDFFRGSWIYDDTQPTYNASMCSFIEKQFDCVGNGRPDKVYLKYRWKPSGCELPKVYNISLMLSRNAFLVDLVIDQKKGRILKLDSIQNGNSWIGFDMLIFNTWHWWLHKGSQKPFDYIQQGNELVKDMDRLTAFGVGLKTWSKWVDSNINPSRTKVFFQGISPTHYNGTEWKASKGATCKGESQPISGSVYPGGALPAVAVVKGVLSNMTTAVELLDVTTLSALRKDGHPSAYGLGGQKGNDCSHWCLAGVPDTWNQLLYAILVTNRKSSMIL
ncbi:hypothetical protein CASFOL_011419 [Castilleja foliolosa]|uniref:Trichome birefringence-like N-terminal domain-containing protein n=1 Tax=Castilleja foliolosa TaxID=1961234 RepID=A0ABD3DZK6_9LAMI